MQDTDSTTTTAYEGRHRADSASDLAIGEYRDTLVRQNIDGPTAQYTGKHREQVAFREVRGTWVLTGKYDGPDNIVVERDGDVVRTITVPGYKIWNAVAHFDDIIAGVEAEQVPA